MSLFIFFTIALAVEFINLFHIVTSSTEGGGHIFGLFFCKTSQKELNRFVSGTVDSGLRNS